MSAFDLAVTEVFGENWSYIGEESLRFSQFKNQISGPFDVEQTSFLKFKERFHFYSLRSEIAAKREQIDDMLREKLVGEFAQRPFEVDDVSMGRLNGVLFSAELVFKRGEKWPGMCWTDSNNELFNVPDIDTLREMATCLGVQRDAIFAIWQHLKSTISKYKSPNKVRAYNIPKQWLELE